MRFMPARGSGNIEAEVAKIIGSKIGRLTIIGFSQWKYRKGGSKMRREPYVLVVCECGVKKETSAYRLVKGLTLSCGCLNVELFRKSTIKHGLSKHRLMHVWGSMYNRCLNENDSEYHNYGGRGIRLCKEWKENFKSFYDWAVKNGYDKSLQIDRKDNNGNYEPTNCRWVTLKQNSRNRRVSVMIEHNGETKNLSEWCEILGMNYKTAHQRLKRDRRTFQYCIDNKI